MNRSTGFTLLESTMSMALVAMVSVPLFMSFSMVTTTGSSEHEEQMVASDAAAVMDEIEKCIQAADEIVAAAENVLTMSTRYYCDDDDGIETIRYKREADLGLYREIADETEVFDTPTLLLKNVTYFAAYTAAIEDTFSSSDYDTTETTVNTGDSRSIDTSVKTKYKVKELGEVDPDLVTNYDASLEKLRIAGELPLTPTTVTVSPQLPKGDFVVSTRFVPLSDGHYRPIVWGDESLDGSSIALEFLETTGQIMLITREAGAIISSATSDITWEKHLTYDLKFRSKDSYATALLSIDRGNYQDVGVVKGIAGSYGELHLQTVTDYSEGIWEMIALDYSFVDLKLGITTDGEERVYYGGAARRQP